MRTLRLKPSTQSQSNSLFAKFQRDILVLKNNIEVHNDLQKVQPKDQHRRLGHRQRHFFLKKISQSKYNRVIMKSFERKADCLRKQEPIYPLESLPTDENQNISNQILATQPVLYDSSIRNSRQTEELKKKVKAKQKILQQEWLKTQNYKTQNSIMEYPSRSKNRRQKYIINKIKKSRPNTSNNSYLSSVFSRNDTFTSADQNI